MENLNEAYRLGYAIITEGITDTLSVKCLGFKNVFAWCGTSRSKKKQRILNRCRYGVIRIPDRDLAGKKTDAVQAFNHTLTLYTPLDFKDSAAFLASDIIEGTVPPRENMRAAIDYCIEKIKEREHHGIIIHRDPVNMV
jgi:DNA primase